jgi:hypothetical protein
VRGQEGLDFASAVGSASRPSQGGLGRLDWDIFVAVAGEKCSQGGCSEVVSLCGSHDDAFDGQERCIGSAGGGFWLAGLA